MHHEKMNATSLDLVVKANLFQRNKTEGKLVNALRHRSYSATDDQQEKGLKNGRRK